jgi:hypothetical protein
LKKRLPQEAETQKLQVVHSRFERITRDQIEKFAIKLWDEYRSHVPEGLSNPRYFQLFEGDFDVWKVIFLKEGCRYSMVNPRCIANYHKRMNTLFNHMQREIARLYDLLDELYDNPAIQRFHRLVRKKFGGKTIALVAHLIDQASIFSHKLDCVQKIMIKELKKEYGDLKTFDSDEGYLGELD